MSARPRLFPFTAIGPVSVMPGHGAAARPRPGFPSDVPVEGTHLAQSFRGARAANPETTP
jgi:hypothetical protein